MRHPAFQAPLERHELIAWYRQGRRRSAELFAIPADDAYYDAPISLRNPIVFYEGHFPVFAVNTLLKRALGLDGIDAEFERLFARGIDPDGEDHARPAREVWPERSVVQQYGREADARIERALAGATLEIDGHPLLQNGEAVFTILEHEEMHHETLLYMLHNLPDELKRSRPGEERASCSPNTRAAVNDWISVPAGSATLGTSRAFGWDNEFASHVAEVAGFSMQRHDVTNGEFHEFVASGAYGDPLLWSDEGAAWIAREKIGHPHFWSFRDGAWFLRGLFGEVPLPETWPVYVTHAEAEAYARWKGARLPTEAEWHRAALGTPDGRERLFPWGDELADARRGNFDFTRWDPLPVGSFPEAASAWGFEDLVGNGWEWTSTPFAPFEGFMPMGSYPEYSSDFFDGRHYVMKGASPVTSRRLVRGSFRNWFRPAYPFVYATFRCAR
jgi:iron(II)-dependent oxidoreductase